MLLKLKIKIEADYTIIPTEMQALFSVSGWTKEKTGSLRSFRDSNIYWIMPMPQMVKSPLPLMETSRSPATY